MKFFVLLQSLKLRESVGLLGQEIILSPRSLPNTNRINADIHALNGNRTHDPSARESEDYSWLRVRGHCDRQLIV
jgi:hypothetical protein